MTRTHFAKKNILLYMQPGTLNDQFKMDVWLNNHSLCQVLECFGIIQLKLLFVSGCVRFQVISGWRFQFLFTPIWGRFPF